MRTLGSIGAPEWVRRFSPFGNDFRNDIMSTGQILRLAWVI